jgi:hypothetical protein
MLVGMSSEPENPYEPSNVKQIPSGVQKPTWSEIACYCCLIPFGVVILGPVLIAIALSIVTVIIAWSN